MKKRLYLITTLILSVAALSLSSCLKDPRAQDFSNVGAEVELPLAATYYNKLVPAALPITATAQTITLVVNVAAPKPLGSALPVTLVIDQAALDAYNTANSTSYTLLPAADYSIASLKVTIPAGQHTVNVPISVNTSLIDPSGQFILPLTLTDASGQKISIYKTLLYNVQAKNKYDMDYAATGYVFHPSAARSIDDTYRLATVGANRNEAPLADLGAANYFFDFDIVPGAGTTATLANWAAAGACPPAPASGFLTADNPAGVDYSLSTDGDTGAPPVELPGGTVYNKTIYNNTYDSSTQTFWMHFGYGTGSSGPSGWTRQFYMKLVAK
jgi:hypothetical protein